MFIITFFSSNSYTALFLSLSFIYFSKLFFFPMMISFYKKNLHSFLGPTTTSFNTATNNPEINNLPLKCSNHNSDSCSKSESGLLDLVTEIGNSKHLTDILESSSIIKSSPPCLINQPNKKRIGFLDDIGDGVDGLMSCTESLGFESSDERRVDIDIDIDDGLKFMNGYRDDNGSCLNIVKPWMKKEKWSERKEVKKYPPPLSSLNHNGKPCFFLRSVRKDGRLELTEVKIHRPEILRAHRKDGRLRLHLIRDEEEDEQKEEEEERDDKWRFGVNGEGFRRCNELLNHQVISQSNNHLPLPV